MATVRNEQLLVETRDFKDLNVPLTRTSRLRYTSLSISEKLIVLGSNTGGIYIFSKADCKLLQIAFADKETAAVTLLLISPNEKFVAFSVSTGKIHVIDLKLDTRSKSETLRSVTDTGGAIVTCLKWDDSSSKLFIGDDMGKVTMVPVHTSKAKSLFSIPMEVIMNLDSAVVQIDKSEDKLLVSTVTCCYLCNTTRDGQFGACFLSQGSTGSMIYCARPGSRIWEVDMEGAVLNTHQFKQLLAVAPLSILDINRNFTLPDETVSFPGQSVAFPKLKIISGRFLLSWNSTSIYVLDPVNVRLVLWTNHFNGILDVDCVRDEIYVFLSTMQVHCLKLMPVSKAIHTCMDETRIEVVARLCCYYGNILHRKHLRKHLGIQDLYKIYNALEVNKMHDLSGEVLGCIKEIEQKVAMETDTDTSSSSRSRSSSIQSANSEIISVVTDTLDVQSKKGTSKVVETKSEIYNGNVGNLDMDTDLTTDGGQSSSEVNFSLRLCQKSEVLDLGSENIDIIGAKDEIISEQILLNDKKETTLEDSTIIGESHNEMQVEDNDSFVTSSSFKSKENENGPNAINIEYIELERGEPEGQSCTTDYSEGKEPITLNEHFNETETIEKSVQERTGSQAFSEEKSDAVKELDQQNEFKHSQFSAENVIPNTVSLNNPEALKSISPSSTRSNMSQNIDDEYDDEDTFDASLTDKINFGPRRPSLTSLSSYSSAEVTMDLPFPESEEQIAIQVKRRVSVRKKKKKRKSSSDVLKSNNQGILAGSPVSVGSNICLSEETSGQTVDGDNMSQYSNDYIDGGLADTADGNVIPGSTDGNAIPNSTDGNVIPSSTDGSVIPGSTDDKVIIGSADGKVISGIIDGNVKTGSTDGKVISGITDENLCGNTNIGTDGNVADDTLILEIPQIVTNTPTDEYTGSGEFHQSSDWGVSGEFTSSDSAYLLSFEQSAEEKMSVSPTSARKLAFRKFKDKMQNQVTSKTKKLIQNIKDKNIISKAKELAETLSQGPDLSLVSGGYLDPHQFDIYQDQTDNTSRSLDTEAKEKDSLNEIPRDVKPLVDILDLQKATDKVKIELKDPIIFTHIDNINKLLHEWIVVLNQTFHRFHMKKFAPSVYQEQKQNNENDLSVSVTSSGAIKQSDIEIDKSSNSKEEIDPAVSTEEKPDMQTVKKDVYPSDMDLKLTSDNFEKILTDPDFCYLADPLKLPSELLTDMSKFVHVCFETGCHGDILSYQKLNYEVDLQVSKEKSELVCDKNQSERETNESKCVENHYEELNDSAKLQFDKTKPTLIDQRDFNDTGTPSYNAQDFVVSRIASNENNMKDQNESTEILPISEIVGDETAEPSDYKTAETKTELISNAFCDIANSSPMNFFIRLYYPYLEFHKIQKKSLLYSEWAALVTCLQGCAIDEGDRLGIKDDSIISHILESRHQKNGGLILLGHISRLFYTKDPSIVEASVRCYPHIQPIDVLYLCCYHAVTMDTVFKEYMLKLLEHLKKIHKPDVEECLFGNRQVRHVWINLLLGEESRTDKLMDDQGNPRVMSHKLVKKNGQLLEQVLSKLGSYQTTDVQDLLRLFYKYGYWQGVLLSLKHLKNFQEHSRIILYLSDIELLSDTQPLGYLPSNMEHWETLLTSFKELRKDGYQKLETEVSDWSTCITWNTLAVLLVKNVGPQLALALLKKFDVENGALNPDFYKTCLLSSMVQKQKRSILDSMLEKVDMYLWSQRPAVVTPQVHYLLVNEDKIKGASSEKDVSHGEETIQSMTTLLKGDKSIQQLPLAEDPDCHWGVKTKFNMLCGCCNIPLKEIVSHTHPGVILFRCGHGFHKQCLPNRECLLCDEIED